MGDTTIGLAESVRLDVIGSCYDGEAVVGGLGKDIGVEYRHAVCKRQSGDAGTFDRMKFALKMEVSHLNGG